MLDDVLARVAQVSVTLACWIYITETFTFH